MPGELDAELGDDVLDIIDDLGKTATYTKVTPGTYSAATGTFTGAATTTFSVVVTPPRVIRTLNGDQSPTRTNEATVLLAVNAVTFEPEIHDRLDIDGSVYAVAGFTTVYSGNNRCVWRLTLATHRSGG